MDSKTRRILDYEKFEQLLLERKMSAADLARETDIGQDVFSRWKSGASEPKIDKLSRIAKMFDVPMNIFYVTKEVNK